MFLETFAMRALPEKQSLQLVSNVGQDDQVLQDLSCCWKEKWVQDSDSWHKLRQSVAVSALNWPTRSPSLHWPEVMVKTK